MAHDNFNVQYYTNIFIHSPLRWRGPVLSVCLGRVFVFRQHREQQFCLGLEKALHCSVVSDKDQVPYHRGLYSKQCSSSDSLWRTPLNVSCARDNAASAFSVQDSRIVSYDIALDQRDQRADRQFVRLFLHVNVL